VITVRAGTGLQVQQHGSDHFARGYRAAGAATWQRIAIKSAVQVVSDKRGRC